MKDPLISNSPKRIVILGAASTGKTTLLNKIQGLLDIQIIPELARVICKELGYKNIYEIKDQMKFRFLVLKKQIERENKLNNFISDRSTIDCWVHWVRWNYESSKTYESEKYFNLSYMQALKYSHIIYIPRMFKAKDDNFRWNDEDYQNQIDRLFKGILLEWDLMKRTHIIQSKDLRSRVKEVLDFLNDR